MAQPIFKGLSFEKAWNKSTLIKFKGMSIEPALPRYFLILYDEAGNVINGATIKIEDANGTEWVNTTTDSSGKAYANRLQYLDQPITFTISKSGYQTTKIIDTITEKIDWRVTLLDWSIVPTEDKVKHGVVYANNTKTGIFKGDVHILDGSVEGASIEGGISGNDNISGDVNNG